MDDSQTLCHERGLLRGSCPDDRLVLFQLTILGLLPFYHSYGMMVIMLYGMMQGYKVVTLTHFEPELFLSSVQKYKVCAVHQTLAKFSFETQYWREHQGDTSLLVGDVVFLLARSLTLT